MKSKKNYFWFKLVFVALALVAMPLANLQAQTTSHIINSATGLVGKDLTNDSLKTAFPVPPVPPLEGFEVDAGAGVGVVGKDATITLDSSTLDPASTGEVIFGTINLAGGNALGANLGGKLTFTATAVALVKATSVTLSAGASDATAPGYAGGDITATFKALKTGNITLKALNTVAKANFEAATLTAGKVTLNMGNEGDFNAVTTANFKVTGDATKRLTIGDLVVNANVGLGSAESAIELNASGIGTLGVDIGDITVNLKTDITDPAKSGGVSAININIYTDTTTVDSNIGDINLNATHASGEAKLTLNDVVSGTKQLIVNSITASAKDAIAAINSAIIDLGGKKVKVTGAVQAVTLADDDVITTTVAIINNSTAKIDFTEATEIEIGGAILAEAKAVTAGFNKALSGIVFTAATKVKAGAVTLLADATSTAAAGPALTDPLAGSTVNFTVAKEFEIGSLEVTAKADSLKTQTVVLANSEFKSEKLVAVTAGDVVAKIGGDLNVNAEFNNQDAAFATTVDAATATATITGTGTDVLEVAGIVKVTATSKEVAASTNSGANASLLVTGLVARIDGGNVTVKKIGKATAIASFNKGLDFSYSNGGHILVATDETAPNSNATLSVAGPLSLSGGNANSIEVKNASFDNKIDKLIVGNKFSTNNAGTTLKLDLATAFFHPLPPRPYLAIVNFYTSGAGVGDTILTVSGLDTTTDVLDLNSLAADKVGVGLAGNKLKVGESLILIAKNDFVTPAATEIAVDTAIANVLNSNGIYLDTDYTIEWLIDGALTLKLGANAKSEEKGVLGGETNSLFFDDLKATGSTPGTNGSVDSLTDADWADFYNKVEADANHPYNSLTKNAKKLYYNLAHIPTFAVATATEYDWVGTDNRSLDFRQAISDYFGNIIPDFVTASAGAFTKDDLIAQFMNTLDPQVYVNSGAFIANTINKNFNTALSRMATSDRTMAYWQAVAAGDNNTDWTIWAQTNIAWENFRDDGDYMGFTSNSYFGYLGADRRFDDFRIGLAGSFGNTELDWNAYGAETDADSFLIKVYAEYDPNDLIVGLAIGAGNISAETQRYTGAGVLGKNKADYDISLFTVDAYVGYRLYTSNLEFLPKASLSYLHSKQDAIKEKGNVPLNLGSVENDSLVGALSVEIKAPLKLEAGHIIKPKIKFGISQEFGDASNTLRTAFPGQAGVAMDSEGLKKKRTSLDVGVGVEAYLNNGVNLFAEYDAEIQSKYNNQSVSLGLEYKF